MNPETRFNSRRRVGGQTIIVAMIILGLLLILGLVFIGIINRNIKTSDRLQDRSIANDLSEAGIRYAHSQLLRSELGADWRGTPTLPVESGAAFMTLDPDAFYLRPAGYLADGTTRLRFIPGANMPVDLGGPDGLGPYFRVQFDKGRALVRVRWAQSDANLFRGDPQGALRNPGLARNYIVIESLGREGKINRNDPTTLTSTTARRYQGYGDDAEFRAELRAFQQAEARFGNFQINRAFASIGIIEHSHFVSNKFRSTRPVEWGIDPQLGARHRGDATSVAENLRFQIGSTLPLQTIASGAANSVPAGSFAGGGSVRINGDLKLVGTTEINLNRTLGDMIEVGGDISSDDPNSRLILNITEPNGAGWITNTATLNPASFSSRSPNFLTGNGILRDGAAELDAANNARGIGFKTPPSILTRDPQTNATRYQTMARDSGVQSGRGNAGDKGYGRNVYIDNGSRRQTPLSATASSVAGAETSLVSEWLSPGGNPSSTGWRGYLYTPPGAYMELQSDGFTIQRDGTGPEATWKLPDGTPTSQNVNRFRLGRGTDGRLHVVNTFTFYPNIDRIHTALVAADYDAGPVFGGVIYFEGNVRVRGVIPTDIQLTIVSNASAYIEGSITKGVVGNHYTSSYPAGVQTGVGARLTRPSRSMLMLMAKDYVALNTTQFFGTHRTQAAIPKEDTPAVGSFNPLIMEAGKPEGMHMLADFVLNPLGNSSSPANPNNPSTWPTFPLSYVDPGNTSNRLVTNLLFSHTMDNGAGAASFFTMNLNTFLLSNSAYLFPRTDLTGIVPFTNLASEYTAGLNINLYGLGSENFERYSQFESIAFPLVNPAAAQVVPGGETFRAASPFGDFELFNTGLNDIHLRPTSIGGLSVNDYLLGRMAITPHDIRIEASIYAEEGSFFVIPGAWFNPNPNDSYENWLAGGTTGDERNLSRYNQTGSYPAMPFYGEPLDVRIQIIGAVSENMPVPISVQSEWMRKWSWIPREQGSIVRTDGTFQPIPEAHTLNGTAGVGFVPNLSITYDPVLASGRQSGFANSSDINDLQSPTIRADEYGRPLPPLPRLPVSPTLAYFGEVR